MDHVAVALRCQWLGLAIDDLAFGRYGNSARTGVLHLGGRQVRCRVAWVAYRTGISAEFPTHGAGQCQLRGLAFGRPALRQLANGGRPRQSTQRI